MRPALARDEQDGRGQDGDPGREDRLQPVEVVRQELDDALQRVRLVDVAQLGAPQLGDPLPVLWKTGPVGFWPAMQLADDLAAGSTGRRRPAWGAS